MELNILVTSLFLFLSSVVAIVFFNLAQKEILRGSKITEKGEVKPEGVAYIVFGVLTLYTG